MNPLETRNTLKEGVWKMSLAGVGFALLITLGLLSIPGCKTTGAIITRFQTEPQWVCPGTDFSPAIHLRIENFDQDKNRSTDGVVLFGLMDITNVAPNQPGLIANQKGTVKLPPPQTVVDKQRGIIETPSSGVHVISGALAKSYAFALTATNTDCNDDCEDYLRKNQTAIEKKYNVDLADAEVMTARADVKLLDVRGEHVKICAPVLEDPTGGWQWVTNEVRAGQRIVIEGVKNINSFPLSIMPPGQPSKILNAGEEVPDFNGHSPNGDWKFRAPNNLDFERYNQDTLKWTGKPLMCVEIGIRCQ